MDLATKIINLLNYLSETRSRKAGAIIALLTSIIATRKIMNYSSNNFDINIQSLKDIKSSKDEKSNSKQRKFDKNFVKTIKKLMSICVPNLLSREFLSIIVLLALMIVRTKLSIQFSEITSLIVKSIIKRDMTEFLLNIISLGVYSIPGAFTNALIDYTNKIMTIKFRENLTKHFQSRFFEDMCYYKMTNLDGRIKNPSQRFTSDIEKFSESICNLINNFFKPLLDIILFAKKLSQKIGWIAPGLISLWYLFTAVVMKFITPPFGKLNAIEQILEGEVRENHLRVIHYGEEIAFYNGGEWEYSYLTSNFKLLVRHIKDIYLKKFLYGVVDSMFAKYGSVTVALFVLGIPTFYIKSDEYNTASSHLNSAEITKDYVQNSSLILNFSNAIGKIILKYKDLNSLGGYSHLLNELDEVFTDVKNGKYVKNMIGETGIGIRKYEDNYKNENIIVGDYVQFENVNLITPNGEILYENINFKILPGQHTFVSGSNGCGKSSLFRILGGLWPIKGGKLTRPEIENIFYIPQKFYLPGGQLREQIIYPMQSDDFFKNGGKDEELEKLLEMVNIPHIVKREKKGLDATGDWKDILSGGEKQRVAMARMYFYKPKYAILDECTSAVSIDVEEKLYNQAKEMGITLITVSHKKGLKKFHDFILKFDEKNKKIVFSEMTVDELNNLKEEQVEEVEEVEEVEDEEVNDE